MPALPRHLPRARCPGPGRAASSWAAAVADHARSGRHAAALTVFRRVLRAHPAVATSDQLAYAALLRCRDHRLAHQIHAQVCRRGLAASNPILACSLLAFYSEDPDKATMMFDEMPNPDAVCYTAMMSALLRAGDWPRALALYPRMLRAAATPPTQHTFSKLLALCASMRLRRHGTQLHAQLLRWGCGAHLNLVLKTALVHMYASCGAMASARAVLQSTPETDVVLWTAIIAAYSRGGQLQAALGAFRDMERAAVPPNAFTYAALIAACSSAHALHIGRQLHARLFKSRLEHDTSACNALLDLYSKGASARLLDLLHAFRAVDTPNVVSWTAFIAGLARHGRDQDAFLAYARMRASGVQPNSFTLSTLLKGCTSAQAFLHAAKIHAYVLKTSFESLDAAVGNSLVDVYARFARMDDAWAVATTMPFIRDIFTYTSLAKGLNQMGLQHRALEMLVHMLHEEIDIDGFSLACFLSAAATMASMEHGKQLHCCSVKLGLSGQVSVSNSLIDMYSRCKCLEDANSAFRSIREPNVVSWNVLISGLVFNERYTEALSAFEDMILAGTQPDGITFSVVLSACSHGGLVDIGIKHFNSMRNLFGVFPQRSHYTCFLDMLGRAGRLTEAAHTIEAMPVQPDLSMYRTLLAFCKLHNDPVVGENIARKALELDPSDAVLQNMLPGIFGAPGDKIVMDRSTG